MPQTKRPMIIIYPTEQEHAELKAIAKSQGLSLSKYLIFVGLRAKINVDRIGGKNDRME